MRKTLAIVFMVLAFASSAYAMVLAGVISSYRVPKAPNVPTSVTATAGSTQNTVSWNAPAVDSGHDAATSYTLYGGTSANPTTVIYTGSGTSYTHTGLTNGTPYYYRVTANNAGGTSGYSSPDATATPVAGLTTNSLILHLNAAKGNGTSAPNGSTPTAWTDLSSSGLNAALSYGLSAQTASASWTSGTPNTVNFPSATDAAHLHAYINRSAVLEPGQITVEMVFRMDTALASFSGSYPSVLMKYRAYSDNAGYGLFFDRDNSKMFWRVYANGAWRDAYFPISFASDTTNYHHLVCTWDGRYSRIYVDGAEVLNAGSPWVDLGAGANYSIVANTAADLAISGIIDGGGGWGSHSHLHVPVLRVYDRALTSGEVSANYANKYATN